MTAFAAGVVLTVSTGGWGAVVVGGALTGAGATAVIHPVAKKINSERMDFGVDYVKEVAIGGGIGVLTAGISAGGASITTSIASKVGTEGINQGAVKLVCRSAVGAVAGATASVVQEHSNPGKFSVSNVVADTLLGAVTGGVSHATSNLTRKLDSELLLKQQEEMRKQYKNKTENMAHLEEPTKMGDRNIHKFDSEHIKQFATDLPYANADRLYGKRRLLYDVHLSENKKKFRVNMIGKIDNHNYDEVPINYGEKPLPDFNKAKPFLLLTKKEEENIKKEE